MNRSDSVFLLFFSLDMNMFSRLTSMPLNFESFCFSLDQWRRYREKIQETIWNQTLTKKPMTFFTLYQAAPALEQYNVKIYNKGCTFISENSRNGFKVQKLIIQSVETTQVEWRSVEKQKPAWIWPQGNKSFLRVNRFTPRFFHNLSKMPHEQKITLASLFNLFNRLTCIVCYHVRHFLFHTLQQIYR